MLEMVLFSPWVFLLFIGALDWGFYATALVSVQAGLRSAVLYTSAKTAQANDSTTACNIMLNEMRKLPNVGNSKTCPSTNPSVTAVLVNSGPDTKPASKVTVTYTSISLIPIPGLLKKQFTLTRSATMRVRSTT
jgi:hypothetical protein